MTLKEFADRINSFYALNPDIELVMYNGTGFSIFEVEIVQVAWFRNYIDDYGDSQIEIVLEKPLDTTGWKKILFLE